MKKCLLLWLIITIVFSSLGVLAEGASGVEVGRHTESDIINIEGQIAYSDIIPLQDVVVLLLNEDGSTAYIEELTPDFLGRYSIKFRCMADKNARIAIKYNGEDVSETLTIAEINGKSTLLDATIVLLNERGTLFDINEKAPMDTHTEFRGAVTDKAYTYTSKYANEYTKGDKAAKAYIKVKNAYGLEESYLPIIACYDDNGKLLTAKLYDVVDVNFDDKEKSTYVDTIDLPEGTARVKAFAWNKDNLVPFGDSNEGTLDKIQVILVGSSAAQTWMGTQVGTYPGEGYGLFLGDFFNPKVVDYYNKAVSGATVPSFFLGKRGNWNSEETGKANGVIDIIKSGNQKGMKSYVLVELGANDISGGYYYPGWENGVAGNIKGTFTKEYFQEYLMRMYNEVAELGGQVIFTSSSGPAGGTVKYNADGTPVPGKYSQVEVTQEGKFIIHEDAGRKRASEYREELANLTGTPYIDCVPAIYDVYNKAIYEDFGGDLEATRGYFLRNIEYIPINFPDIDPEDVVLDRPETGNNTGTAYTKEIDYSHTSIYGAEEIAHCLYEEFLKSDCELKFYMR